MSDNTNNTAVVKKDFRDIAMGKDVRFKRLSESFASMKNDIARALPEGKDPEQMVSIMIATIQKNDALLKCDPVSLFGAFIQTALLGLSPVLGEAWVIPYKGQAQFQMGARGYVTLAYRSGIIAKIDSSVVYSGDEFKVVKGTNPQIIHTPNYDTPRSDKDIIGAYAIAFFKEGHFLFEYMTRAEIDKIRLLAMTQKVWGPHYAEMCRKTVIKRLGKALPKEQLGSTLSNAFVTDGGILRLDQFQEQGKGILPEHVVQPEYEENSENKIDEMIDKANSEKEGISASIENSQITLDALKKGKNDNGNFTEPITKPPADFYEPMTSEDRIVALQTFADVVTPGEGVKERAALALSAVFLSQMPTKGKSFINNVFGKGSIAEITDEQAEAIAQFIEIEPTVEDDGTFMPSSMTVLQECEAIAQMNAKAPAAKHDSFDDIVTGKAEPAKETATQPATQPKSIDPSDNLFAVGSL